MRAVLWVGMDLWNIQPDARRHSRILIFYVSTKTGCSNSANAIINLASVVLLIGVFVFEHT